MNYFRGNGMTGICAIKSTLDRKIIIKKVIDSITTDRATSTKDIDTISNIDTISTININT